MMKNWLVALMLAVPVAAMALDTESTPQVNTRKIDIAVGKIAVAEKNWQAAVDAFNRAAKNDPRNADVHNYLGYSYRNMDKMDLAFRHYNEALKLDPDHRGANEYIGWAYLKTNQLSKAEEHLVRLDKICGQNCQEYQSLNKGVAEYKAKNKS